MEAQEITFDGVDGDLLVCPAINIWPQKANRAKPVATVAHGSQGKLVRRKGDMCFVEVEVDGNTRRGWLTFYFIQELKEQWNQMRRRQLASLKN